MTTKINGKQFMKLLIDRDFRELLNRPEWISLEESDLSKNIWKKFGSKSNYLDTTFSSGWRMIFAGKNRLLSNDAVLNLLQKSFDYYFKDEKFYQEFLTDIESIQNINYKKKERMDSISLFKTEILVKSIHDYLLSKNYVVELHQIEDFIHTHPEFCYSIPFIDQQQLIKLGERNNPWDENSIEAFLRNNLLIQVKLMDLEIEGEAVALFLRKDLKLGKGKSGAQLSHGLISLLHQPTFKTNAIDEYLSRNDKNILIYTVSDLRDLQEIQHLCLQNKVNNSLVVDAGHTQIDPGTATVIAVGPIPKIWLKILAFNMEATELN